MDDAERRRSGSLASTAAFSTQPSLSALPDELARRLDLVDQVMVDMRNSAFAEHAGNTTYPAERVARNDCFSGVDLAVSVCFALHGLTLLQVRLTEPIGGMQLVHAGFFTDVRRCWQCMLMSHAATAKCCQSMFISCVFPPDTS